MPHRMVGYRCSNCKKYKTDALYMPGEKPLKYLKEKCPKCGGEIEMWDIKDNDYNWKFFDTRR